MPSPLAERVIGILSPSVGDFIARAKVSAACKLAKLDLETLEHRHLSAFAEKLELTCGSLGSSVAGKIKVSVLSL